MILEEAYDGIVGGHYAGKETALNFFVCKTVVAHTSQRC
jgi:hypothetical protein